jgi:hypothetical protein
MKPMPAAKDMIDQVLGATVAAGLRDIAARCARLGYGK